MSKSLQLCLDATDIPASGKPSRASAELTAFSYYHQRGRKSPDSGYDSVDVVT
jgi:hypothetical protein